MDDEAGSPARPEAESEPGTPTRRERTRAATVAEIKHHAWAQVAEGGALAVSLRAVARSMGMTSSALYRYFESREQLVNVLFQEWKQAYGSHLMTGLEFTGSVRSICHEIWSSDWSSDVCSSDLAR